MHEKYLDLESEWEEVCNDRTAPPANTPEEHVQMFHARREQDRRTGYAYKAIWSLFGALFFFLLFTSGLLVGWMALPVSAALACYTSAMAGRFLESRRR